MSNIPKILGYAAGYMLVTLIVGSAILAVLTLAIMWLVPIATAGTLHLEFIQAVSIITLALLARVVMFQNN